MSYFVAYLADFGNLAGTVHIATQPAEIGVTLETFADDCFRQVESDRQLPCLPSDESELILFIAGEDDLPPKTEEDDIIHWDTDRSPNAIATSLWISDGSSIHEVQLV